MLHEQRKPLVVLIYVTIACSLWKCLDIPVPVSPDVSTTETLSIRSSAFWLGEQKLIAAFLLFGLMPLLIVKVGFREKLSEHGLRLGVKKLTLRSFLIMAPAVVLIAIATGHQAAFFDIYPFNEQLRSVGKFATAHGSQDIPLSLFAVHACLYLGYYFGWEFLFRGFLQHGLSERTGLPIAILVQTMASTMLHYGHPPAEIFASIIAGIVWGWLAVRTRSLISGMAQHALLGIVLDWTLIHVGPLSVP